MRRWVDLQMRISRRRRDGITSDHAYRFKMTCRARSHSTGTLGSGVAAPALSRQFDPTVRYVLREHLPPGPWRQLSYLDWKQYRYFCCEKTLSRSRAVGVACVPPLSCVPRLIPF